MEYTDKKQFITALFAAWNSHELERIAAFYSPHCEGIDIAQPTSQRGMMDIQRWIESYLQAVPDMNFLCEEIILESNRAAAVWNVRGTHQGSLMHIPPTYKQFHIRGVTTFTFEGDKISHLLNIWDVAGLLRDIGFLPEL